MTRVYGWKRSPIDTRDHVADTTGLPIAPEVDPRGKYMTPVYDQLALGSCTANAVAAAIDAWRLAIGLLPLYPSRLAIYAGERQLEHAPVDQDTGAFGRDGFKFAQRVGLWPETDWPYTDQAPAWWQAPHLITATHPVAKLDAHYKAVRRSETSIKRVLSNRQTIAFGFTVYESFEGGELASTGIMPMPQKGEQVLGGHEVLAVGYLLSYPDHVLVRNSWGSAWGQGGYFLMPWKFLLGGDCDDLRTIYRAA